MEFVALEQGVVEIVKVRLKSSFVSIFNLCLCFYESEDDEPYGRFPEDRLGTA